MAYFMSSLQPKNNIIIISSAAIKNGTLCYATNIRMSKFERIINDIVTYEHINSAKRITWKSTIKIIVIFSMFELQYQMCRNCKAYDSKYSAQNKLRAIWQFLLLFFCRGLEKVDKNKFPLFCVHYILLRYVSFTFYVIFIW